VFNVLSSRTRLFLRVVGESVGCVATGSFLFVEIEEVCNILMMMRERKRGVSFPWVVDGWSGERCGRVVARSNVIGRNILCNFCKLQGIYILFVISPSWHQK